MKTKFYSLLFLFCLSFLGYSQTGLGNYSAVDGGFENQTAGNLTNATLLAAPTWTTNTNGGGNVRTVNGTGGRSGPKYVTFGLTSAGTTTAKYYYSAQLPGAFLANTKYQIQFFVKSASSGVTATTGVNMYVNNSTTAFPGNTGRQFVDAALGTAAFGWTKKSYEITTNATAPLTNGLVGFSIAGPAATAYTLDIDDYVIYQGDLDPDAPLSPGAITATGVTAGANVSWAAASGGVDGGGYVVIRYAGTAPLASDDPNQNGIYAKGNAVGAGEVRYIGTAISFADTGLSPGVDYYYKVYTVDKAFNYSNESVTSTPVQSLATTYYYNGVGLLTDLASWGLNSDGTGTAPANFTDASQVFEIRNTAAVALDGAWVVGASNGTKVRLGNAAAVTLTLNSGASIGPSGSGNFDVLAPPSGNHTVIYNGTTLVSFGNIFDTNLEVIYDGVTVSTSSTKNFGTVTIKNGADVTFSAAVTIDNLFIESGATGTFTLLPVITNIIVNGTLVTPTTATSYITIPIGGSVVINGTVITPKLTGFVSSGVTPSSAGADIQFIGTENLTLGANSIVDYNRVATSNQIVTPRTDYKNVTLSGTVPKSISGTTAIAGTLTINSGIILTVTAPVLTVTGAIANSGTMTLDKASNLIQGGTTNTNTGAITVNRNSNPLLRLDYTLWSSPVASQNLLAFSPDTFVTRFYTYNTGTNLYNAIADPATTNFTAGKGYLIRMPDNASETVATPFSGVFTGIPNNGTIPVPVTIGYNLVGNPYPSNISFSSLQSENSGLIGTTAYFWRKTNGAGGSAYCTYNSSGSTYITNGAPGAAAPGSFDGIIQSGQGFFVAATAAGDLNFTNTQRTTTTTNQAFFKTKQVATADKVWLNATNAAGDFSQMAVTYSAGATTGVDNYDSKYINDSGYALTSAIDGGEYTIQGRPIFDATDMVALNFKTITAGDYTIALAHSEGVFANGQDVYLTDSTTGAETNLKTDAYTFTAAAGADNARFSLKYQKTLKVIAPAFNENSVTVYTKNGTLYVNSGAIAIQNIRVFDIQGRLIAQQNNVKANTTSISNLKANQTLIVQVTSQDNTVVNKKVVN